MSTVSLAKATGCLLLLTIMLCLSAPAFAQLTTDFSGEWGNRNHEEAWDRVGGPCPGIDCGGPPPGDYLGLALNDAGRMRADSADTSDWGLPEFQCRPHSVPYIWRAAGDMRINKEVDPVSRELVAYHVNFVRSMDRTVYMDERPHPPEEAAHTWEGFSTGKWDGNTLVVTVTHVKESYLRRNNVMFTDKAKITEYWTRHGDIFTIVGVIDDPTYLEIPYVFSVSYVLNVHTELEYFPCTVVEENITTAVPHILPSADHKYQTDWVTKFGIPVDAARGRKETLYPEYQLKLKQAAK